MKHKKFFAKIRSKKAKKIFLFGSIGILTVLLLANIVIFAIYKNKTYPNTTLNQQKIGNITFNELNNHSQKIISLPNNIILKVADKSSEQPPDQLGLSIDHNAIKQSIIANRHWLPMANLYISHNNNGEYIINNDKYDTAIADIATKLEHPPTNATIEIKEDDFIIVNEISGKQVDTDKSKETIIKNLKNNISKIELPTKEILADTKSDKLQPELNKLQNNINTKITIKYGDKTISLTRPEIIKLYFKQESKWQLSNQNISALLDNKASSLGIRLGNKKQATESLTNAILSAKSSTIEFTAAPKIIRTYNYCVAAKGVDESYLAAFKSKLRAVYADPRGWSLDGTVNFVEVASNCNYTAWLTRADLVPSFSSTICDSIWSCRVGNNVIINFDRWTNASPSWNSAAGSLDDYRSMVINHETGHWFGFSHRYCSGAGQPAPVMQQQSISLQGCKFSAWPNASELASRRNQLGI